MTALIENMTEYNIDDELIDIINNVIEVVLRYEGISNECEVSVTFVDDDEIKRLNNQFRDIDKVTDVLSFPINDFSQCEDYDFESIGVEKNIDTDEYILGDIIICYNRALEQANEYGHTFEREVGFLTAHSMLHLLGYDHMEKDEEDDMIKRQKNIMKEAGLQR